MQSAAQVDRSPTAAHNFEADPPECRVHLLSTHGSCRCHGKQGLPIGHEIEPHGIHPGERSNLVHRGNEALGAGEPPHAVSLRSSPV